MFYLIFFTSFVFSSSICFFIDYCYPNLRVNKISRKKVLEDYQKMIPVVSKNLLISYPIFYLTELYLKFNKDYDDNKLLYIFYWLIVSEILFYSIHYVFHKINYLYKNFHSIHHQFNYTYGMSAIYAHPLDLIIANILPTFFLSWIYPPSDNTAKFIIIFSTFYTVIISHGCYKFLDKTHLQHHLYYNKNYGLFIADDIMKTKKIN